MYCEHQVMEVYESFVYKFVSQLYIFCEVSWHFICTETFAN